MVAAVLRPTTVSDDPSRKLTLESARRELQDMEQWLESAEARSLPLHELEQEQESRMREVNRLFLKSHLETRGTGDVGPAIEVADTEDPKVMRVHSDRRLHRREIKTIFGEIAIHRHGYGAREQVGIHPLDEDLCLAKRSFSYTIQEQLARAAVQGPFDEAVERLEERTGLRISKRSAEQIVEEVAEYFDAFYDTRKAVAASKTGPILVGAVDCKGIPMVKTEKSERVVRRGRGQKPNKKKMATVAAAFTQMPRIRTPEQVIQSLFEPDEKPDRKPVRRGPENKRVWASLQKSKDEVIAEVAAEMRRRDPRHRKTWTVVADGERALKTRLKKALPENVIIVLDFLHVLERLWTTAYVYHPEQSPEAKQWVRERALRILRGEVSQVIKGLRQSSTKRRLRGKDKKTVEGTANYYWPRRENMKYDEYLSQGLPIASGAVEGACKNLIKDRMERSGMRWTEPMAEAMIKLRAVDRSHDWHEFWKFHVRRDQHRLHPENRWKLLVEK